MAEMLLCSFHLNLKVFDGLFSIQFSQIICVHLQALNGFINIERKTSVRNVQRFTDRAPSRLHEEKSHHHRQNRKIHPSTQATDFGVCVNKAKQWSKGLTWAACKASVFCAHKLVCRAACLIGWRPPPSPGQATRKSGGRGIKCFTKKSLGTPRPGHQTR